MIMVNWLINGMKYNSLIRWTMWLAQTFKPADKVYLFVAPRSAWNKIYVCVVFVYLQKQEMSLFKVGLCRLSWQTYFKYWLLVTVQKWMFYHRLGITVFFMVFHPCHTFSNWFNVVPCSVRLQFSLFLRPFHLLVLFFCLFQSCVILYLIFLFIHSFIYSLFRHFSLFVPPWLKFSSLQSLVGNAAADLMLVSSNHWCLLYWQTSRNRYDRTTLANMSWLDLALHWLV